MSQNRCQMCDCVLSRILQNCNPKLRHHMLCGAFIELTDGGVLYNYLKLDQCGKPTNLSSHRSGAQQYRCTKMIAPLLYDVSADGDSWFEFQRHEVADPCHIIDYCMYLSMDRNIGPNGISYYTEARKLKLDARETKAILRCAHKCTDQKMNRDI